ncbi:two-component system response regulator RppA [Spirulina major]|uniref:two-component system response regulator RppA n=1 Tax=Spirulina major TaxID=270636 RepID=UPI0009336CBF|nr:two-component system response regulator RppA [Spirulina major]
MRILLVDDEVELTAPLSQALGQEGYQVDVAHRGSVGLALAQAEGYQLLILDWMMPSLSGLEICQALRSHGDETPVLFLTAKDTLDDRVQGLDAGADDYLVKPFELRELLARVRALLRRSPAQSSPRFTIADLEFDPDNRVAYRGDRQIDLSEKEAQLLCYFLQHRGQVLTHITLQAHLWGPTAQPNSNVLAALVRLLRRKLEHPPETALIHTVYGKGYRFGEGER